MKRRTVNNELLRELIHEHGLGGLSERTGVSVSWLQKAMAGCYKHEPRILVREAICREYSVKMDELFPMVTAKGKAS